MDSSLLPVGVLAAMLLPAYVRFPWLLVLAIAGGAAAAMIPQWLEMIRLGAMGGIAAALLGYFVVMMNEVTAS